MSLVTTGGAAGYARLPQDRERLLAVLSRVQGRFVPDTTAERMSDYEAMRIHELGDSTVEARVRRRYGTTASTASSRNVRRTRTMRPHR